MASSHKGTIGIEGAILLIAIVAVGAAFAFVIVNSGFGTTQKAKSSTLTMLSEVGASLKNSGKIVAAAHVGDGALNVTAIPIKTAGGNPVDLSETFTAVKLITNDISHAKIYSGTITGTVESLRSATASAKILTYIDQDPFVDNTYPSQSSAFVYWTINNNNNDILDPSEQAVLAVVFSQSDRPRSHEKFAIQLVVSGGAPLAVERFIPAVHNEFVDLC
jgi:flagellin FlaB